MTSKPEPSELVKASPLLSDLWMATHLTPEEVERQALDTKRIIEQQTGKTLSERQNPNLGEGLMIGHIGSRPEALADDHVEPLRSYRHSVYCLTHGLGYDL